MHYALKKGYKMVVHVHGGLFLTAPRIPFLLERILKWVFSWDVPFIVLSEGEKEILEKRFGAKRVEVLPNCPDAPKGNDTQSEIATIRGCATTIHEHGSLRYGASAYDNVELLNPLNPSTIELITKLGLKEFAGAVMYVMREVFAMPEERMLCRPDEKRGRKLLEEIMIGGNFGKFDERYNWAETTSGSMDYRGASYAVARLRHNFQFLKDYPSEVLWEPIFRVYHWVWRKFRLWKFE
jgi:hypothetical protein